MEASVENLQTVARAELASSVANLYEVFEKYEDTTAVSGCDHCITREDAESIAGDTRELSAQALGGYVSSAIHTWGGVDDFKRFLPRIYELLADSDYFGVDIAVGKLQHAEWKTWPQPERDAVTRYLRALLVFTVTAGNADSTLHLLITTGASIGFNAAELLKEFIEEDQSFSRTTILCWLIDQVVRAVSLSKRPSFKGYEPLHRWLKSEQVKNRLEEAFYATLDDSSSNEMIAQREPRRGSAFTGGRPLVLLLFTLCRSSSWGKRNKVRVSHVCSLRTGR